MQKAPSSIFDQLLNAPGSGDYFFSYFSEIHFHYFSETQTLLRGLYCWVWALSASQFDAFRANFVHVFACSCSELRRRSLTNIIDDN